MVTLIARKKSRAKNLDFLKKNLQKEKWNLTFGQHEKTHLPKGMIFKDSKSYQEHQINYFFTFHSNSFLSSHFLASICSPETQDLLSILQLSLREPLGSHIEKFLHGLRESSVYSIF